MRYDPQPRACIEPGCGTVYKPRNPNQQRCHEHMTPRLLVRQVFAPKVCKFCERMFDPINGRALYCSEGCKRSEEVRAGEVLRRQRYGERQCACGERFLPRNGSQRRCPTCSLGLVPLPALPPATALPCARCRHGALSVQAELGVECQAGLWLRCRPLADASCFAAQEAQEEAE